MDVDTRQELAEAIGLLEAAKGPRVRKALSDLITSLQQGQAATAAPAAVDAPAEEADPANSSNGISSNGNGSTTESAAAMSGSHLPAAGEEKAAAAASPAPGSGPQGKVEGGVPAAPRATEKRYAMVEKFAWDQGGYNSPKVSVYVPLEGVGAAKERVSCSFTTRGFDLTVEDLNGKSYRLVQNNLDKDIVVDESKFLVKKDKVIVKLQKVKGEYGSYDHWSNLAAKKTKRTNTKADPQAGLMDMMKDMYDDGDESTKKLIGEAMMKSQQNRGKPDAYGGSDATSGLGAGSKFSSSAAGLGGLGKMGGKGLDSPAANFDSMMDDLNLDKDAGGGGDGWGAGGKDDFGFGSAEPPPQQASLDPVPAASEEEEEEEDAQIDGGKGEGAVAESADSAKPAKADAAPNPLEALDL